MRDKLFELHVKTDKGTYTCAQFATSKKIAIERAKMAYSQGYGAVHSVTVVVEKEASK